MSAWTSELHGGFERDFIPTLRTDFARADIESESVVWSPSRLRPTVVDPVSKVLLDVIDGGATVGEICQDVSEVVGVTTDAAFAQVHRSLGLFDTAGLLVTSAGTDEIALSDEIFLTPPNT
jgi:hypothetical protein